MTNTTPAETSSLPDLEAAIGHNPSSAALADHPPTVWIVDDDEAITALISRISETISLQPRAFVCCGDFLSAYEPTLEGCLVTDINMPGMSGLELLRQLHDQKVFLSTVLITGYASIPLCVEAMKIGAFDFLQKPFSPAQLKAVIPRAIERTRQQRAARLEAEDIRTRLATLDDEERRTLQMMREGCMNQEIADTLDVSRRTVQYRVASLLNKIGVKTRGELISRVAAASANGLST